MSARNRREKAEAARRGEIDPRVKLGAWELCRRINFIEQMKPKNRNKPRNMRRLCDYRAALVAC